MNKTAFTTVLLLLFTGTGAAQSTPAMPSSTELEKQRAHIETQRKQMFDPKNPATRTGPGFAPRDSDIRREIRKIESERKQLFDPQNPATKDAINSFPDIATPERSGIDVEALAKRYEQKAAAGRADGLMVFVSFTMPRESLKRAIAEANRVGGVVVMRGFKDGSVKATAQAINELGEASGNVQINPNAFTKYRVHAVPAVVLAKPEGFEAVDKEGCALPDKYVMVSGDVGLSYALEEIERRAPAFQEMAARYGRPLRGAAR
jgi:conjugal transfer pilus assembly protein TrbC